MRIIFLSDIATAVMDVIAWICFHISIGYWSSRIPLQHFNPEKWLYLTRGWEQDGEIYQKLFHVREWKNFIPNGSALYPNTFKMKNLPTLNINYLETWLRESCRAEFCHLIMILPGFLFFLWNSVETGWWMVGYAVANNLVPIVMQRFNRPRVRRLLTQMKKNLPQKQELYVDLGTPEALPYSYR